MASQSSSQTSQGVHHNVPQLVVQSFSNPVAMKLDEENYLPWKQQAEATIEGHDLLNHITGKGILKKFATTEDQENEIVNPDYQQEETRYIIEILVTFIDDIAIHHKNGWM